MKKLILLVFVIALTGCTKSTFRTGATCIDKFDITNTKVSNPIDIKQDVLIYIRDALHRSLVEELTQDSKLTYVPSCDVATYRISGDIAKVNSKVQRKMLGASRQKMEVSIKACLESRTDNAIIATTKAHDEDDDMNNLLNDLSGTVIKKLSREKVAPNQP